jgi:DNA-directed RNA polymerase specialized sigma24 family protein
MMDTISSAVHTAFRTALLLGAATSTAEAAVLDGIDACGHLSHRGFLIETVRSTIRRRMKSAHAVDEIELLPPELRRLFLLPPLLRDCFVLRILVGLSTEVCAEILGVSNIEFEDAVCAALNQLPLLSSSTV